MTKIAPGRPPNVAPITSAPDPAETPAAAIEKEVLEALRDGYPAVAEKAAALEDFLKRARLVAEAFGRVLVQIDVLSALAVGGYDGLEDGIDALMEALPRLQGEELERTELQIDVLRRLTQSLEPLKQRLQELHGHLTLALLPESETPVPLAEKRALTAFLAGSQQIEEDLEEIEDGLQSPDTMPGAKAILSVGHPVVLAVRGGLTGVRAKIEELEREKKLIRNEAGQLTIERALRALASLEKVLAVLDPHATCAGNPSR
jgi:hypothetical protein